MPRGFTQDEDAEEFAGYAFEEEWDVDVLQVIIDVHALTEEEDLLEPPRVDRRKYLLQYRQQHAERFAAQARARRREAYSRCPKVCGQCWKPFPFKESGGRYPLTCDSCLFKAANDPEQEWARKEQARYDSGRMPKQKKDVRHISTRKGEGQRY